MYAASNVITRLIVALESRYAVKRKLCEGRTETVHLVEILKHEQEIIEKFDLCESSHGYCRGNVQCVAVIG